jgi:hypothetical protein
MANKIMIFVFTVIFLLGLPSLGYRAGTNIKVTRPDSARVGKYADSAGVLKSNVVVDTDALTSNDSISINAPAFKLYADTMFFSSAWCGYDSIRYPVGGDDPCTNFVRCPIVGDSTNTIVLLTAYNPWVEGTFATATSAARNIPFVDSLWTNEGFVVRYYEYVRDNVDTDVATDQCGYFWTVIRYRAP